MNASEPQFLNLSSSGVLAESDSNGSGGESSGRMPPVYRQGDVLGGRYKLLSLLGEGGMGSVWKARSLALQVDVAVKVVKRSESCPKACERLLREARAAASLVHPSIVRMLDCGTTDDGEPFLVMQLLRGTTLGKWMHEHGRLPATTAVQLILPIAGALAEVHDLGIVHRDIKPENIVIEPGYGGQLVPKLVDFGIAKQSTADDASFTQSGVLMGSPAYMSPEQARGIPDAQSDVWSLCVVIYEMITGKRPFEGIHHGAVLFAVFADDPEPTHLQGAGDEELWEILRVGLAKKPDERWASMRALGRALAGWAVSHDVAADSAGTAIAHQWLARRHERALDLGPLSSARSRRSRPPEPMNGEHRANTMSSITLSEPEVSLPPARRRGPLMGLCSGIALVAGIVTFLTLAPAGAPNATAASLGSRSSTASAAIATELLEALPARPHVRPDAGPAIIAVAAPSGSGSTPSVPSSAATTAKVREPSAAAHTAARGVPARAASRTLSLPLPFGPDF